MSTDHWHWDGRLLGVSWQLNVYRHHYSDQSHRWVYQPSVHWDRRCR